MGLREGPSSPKMAFFELSLKPDLDLDSSLCTLAEWGYSGLLATRLAGVRTEILFLEFFSSSASRV